VHLARVLQARESCEGPEILPVNIDKAVYKVVNMLADCRSFTRALLSLISFCHEVLVFGRRVLTMLSVVRRTASLERSNQDGACSGS
jgi:hypothetical protein